MFTEKAVLNKGAVFLLFDKEENFMGRAFIEDMSENPIKIFTYVDKKHENEYEEMAGLIYSAIKNEKEEEEKIKMEFVMRFLIEESTKTVVLK
jgi:hypothetical protein